MRNSTNGLHSKVLLLWAQKGGKEPAIRSVADKSKEGCTPADLARFRRDKLAAQQPAAGADEGAALEEKRKYDKIVEWVSLARARAVRARVSFRPRPRLPAGPASPHMYAALTACRALDLAPSSSRRVCPPRKRAGWSILFARVTDPRPEVGGAAVRRRRAVVCKK